MDLIEDKKETFTCVATNGYPEASIQWLLDGVNITQTSAVNVLDKENMKYMTESVLEFTPNRVDNGKSLTCEVSRLMLDRPMLTNSTGVLNVKCKFILIR